MTVDDEATDPDGYTLWFADYLTAFAAGAAGDKELRALLAFYAVPLTVTTDGGVITSTTTEQVTATIHQQLDSLRHQNYAYTTIERFDVTVLNDHSALLGTTLLRRQVGGDPLQAVSMTYLVTGSPSTRHISVMAVSP